MNESEEEQHSPFKLLKERCAGEESVPGVCGKRWDMGKIESLLRVQNK
jgi:hypothetical protein